MDQLLTIEISIEILGLALEEKGIRLVDSDRQFLDGARCRETIFVKVRNECLQNEDNDCDAHAQCIDTDEGFLCVCLPGYMDNSTDQKRKPGRVCTKTENESLLGTARCSPYAYCIETPESYVCRCKPGYIDFSPNPQYESGLDCRPLLDECRTGQHTTCHDTADSYTCQCKPGFKDMDELRNPGRNCQPILTPKTPCDDGTHNCHTYARCRATGSLSYTCECLSGYEDKSPSEKPGRFCAPKQPICLDKSKMVCQQYAICQESNAYPEGFTCHCRDGYVDKYRKPGRICQEKVNYCMERSLNDCYVIAFCEELSDGYNCTCQPYSIDQSPVPGKPGRKCKLLKNECLNPAENNCSRFADCIDKTEGYECVCRAGFPTAQLAYSTLIRWIIDCNNFQFGPCFKNDSHPKLSMFCMFSDSELLERWLARQPFIALKINGVELRFLVDTGAVSTVVSKEAVRCTGARYLPSRRPRMTGISGETPSAGTALDIELEICTDEIGRPSKFFRLNECVILDFSLSGLLGMDVMRESDVNLREGWIEFENRFRAPILYAKA